MNMRHWSWQSLAVVTAMWAGGAGALTLDVPGNPRLMVEDVTPQTSFALPIGRWSDGTVPVRLTEGEVTRQVWRMIGGRLSSVAITSDLRRQLQAQGFSIVLDCAAPICGGFDFRREVDVMPPPAMHVNLADYRYLSAEISPRGGAAERVGILVSVTGDSAAVQIIRAGVPLENSTLAAPAPDTVLPFGGVAQRTPDLPDDFGVALESMGRVVLSDLAFETGSAQLATGAFPSLQAVADYLRAHPARRVALVGHTDTEGSLDVNIGLSKRRAASVMERLSRDYGVPRQQLSAEGMGYLAPLSANLTPEGRNANRRVEVVLLSTD